jgi:hypothetical protein
MDYPVLVNPGKPPQGILSGDRLALRKALPDKVARIPVATLGQSEAMLLRNTR